MNKKDRCALTRCIFSGMQILIGEQFVTGKAVVIDDGVIKAIIDADEVASYYPALHYTLKKEHRLTPGLIDLHIHGTHGNDVMDGDVQGLKLISQNLASEGVAGYLATTMTANKEKTELAIKSIRHAMSHQDGAAILGIHLEGPFISPKKLGAQNPEDTQTPDSVLIQQWHDLSGGAIKLVTLAPELPGALELIIILRQMNIVASIGHTNANYDQVCKAISQGATYATHLFNAMNPMHHRDPGASGALLQSKQVMTELIVDGFHLHPFFVEMVFQLKGVEGILLITDSMRAKGLCDGVYELGGQKVHVEHGKALLSPDVLAGSTTSLLAAVKKMAEYSKCTLAQAFFMATHNPAKAVGLTHKGSIKIGYDADFVLFDEQLQVMMTMRQGQTVYKNEALLAELHINLNPVKANYLPSTSIPYEIEDDANKVAQKVASKIHHLIKKNNTMGLPTVLGLATGGTVIPLYAELIRLYQQENNVNFYSRVITFNLDEYQGLSPNHPSSYSYFMHNNLFNHVNIPKQNVHLLDGTITDATELEDHLSHYERQIAESGGIDLQILGIGVNGHIAFNEPGSAAYSRTRVVTLDKKTIESNARFFF